MSAQALRAPRPFAHWSPNPAPAEAPSCAPSRNWKRAASSPASRNSTHTARACPPATTSTTAPRNLFRPPTPMPHRLPRPARVLHCPLRPPPSRRTAGGTHFRCCWVCQMQRDCWGSVKRWLIVGPPGVICRPVGSARASTSKQIGSVTFSRCPVRPLPHLQAEAPPTLLRTAWALATKHPCHGFRWDLGGFALRRTP